MISEQRRTELIGSATLSLALLLPALINGFPFIYPDSEAYLAPKFPPTHTPFYGVAIFPFHVHIFPWGVVLMQSAMTAWLIHVLLRRMSIDLTLPQNVFMAASLTLFSSLPWCVGFVMPDLFSGLLIIVLLCLAYPSGNLSETCVLIALGAAFISFHLSNVMLALAIMVACACLKLLPVTRSFAPWDSKLRLRPLLLCQLIAVAGIVGATYLKYHRVGLPPAGNNFPLARLLADGTAKKYLTQTCRKTEYYLCPYLASIPDESERILWDPTSPLNNGPQLDEMAKQNSAIIRGTLASYPFEVMSDTIAYSAQQLVHFNTASELQRQDIDWRLIITNLKKMFPAWAEQFPVAVVSQAQFPEGIIGNLLSAGFLGSLILVASYVALGVRLGQLNARLITFATVVSCALCTNAVITGGLSNVRDRYQARVAWLVVLAGVMALFEAQRLLARRYGGGRL